MICSQNILTFKHETITKKYYGSEDCFQHSKISAINELGKTIGFITFSGCGIHYIKVEVEGEGIGSKLFSLAKKHLFCSNGCRKISLNSHLESVGFWSKQGFELDDIYNRSIYSYSKEDRYVPMKYNKQSLEEFLC